MRIGGKNSIILKCMMLLWALSVGERAGPRTLSAFPNEHHPGPRLPHALLQRLFYEPSPLYAALVESIARVQGVPSVLPRDPVVLLAHLFLDRLVRVSRVLPGNIDVQVP